MGKPRKVTEPLSRAELERIGQMRLPLGDNDGPAVVREAKRRAHKHGPKTPRPQVVPDRRLRDKAERRDTN